VSSLNCAGRGFNRDVLTRGCMRGIVRWLPFGGGAALYYSLEYLSRPLGRPATSEEAYDRASFVSKGVAGAAAGTLVTLPMYAARWPGFHRPGSIPIMALSCGIGALLMPDFEEIDRRVGGGGGGWPV
jgi:hypothetical protein